MMVGTEDTNNQVPTQAEVLRERQRFLNLVEKINKLEEAINTFEADHESIDSNVDWLSRLTTMRNEMEQAHKTKGDIQTASDEIQSKKSSVEAIAVECENDKKKVDAHQQKIAKILSDAEMALTSATSAGLAKEFEKQKDILKKKERFWVIALGFSLVLALVLTYCRLAALQELMVADKPVTGFVFVLNCLISIAAIGTPVWFAWLATKQVGYCFRLSEDYAFKAATAGSFEGFRREIESLTVDDENESNGELRLKLLTTVLTRLDEQPLRYVDSKVHGSPFHEALLNRFKTKLEEKKPE